MGWMLSRGPPALTACPLGDSSNTRLLSARTNIWGSVMKSLGEQEGMSQNPEAPTASRDNRKWRWLWEGKQGSQGYGMWRAPHACPFTQPRLQGGPEDRGYGLGRRHHPASLQKSLENSQPPPPPPTPSVQTGKPRLWEGKNFVQAYTAQLVHEGGKETWNDRGSKRQAWRQKGRRLSGGGRGRQVRAHREETGCAGWSLLCPCPWRPHLRLLGNRQWPGTGRKEARSRQASESKERGKAPCDKATGTSSGFGSADFPEWLLAWPSS